MLLYIKKLYVLLYQRSTIHSIPPEATPTVSSPARKEPLDRRAELLRDGRDKVDSRQQREQREQHEQREQKTSTKDVSLRLTNLSMKDAEIVR